MIGIGQAVGSTVIAVALAAFGVVADTEVTRTSRGGSDTPITRESRGNTSETGRQTPPVSAPAFEEGEWEYEGPGMFDMLYWGVTEVYPGVTIYDMEEFFDPQQMAFEAGVTYNGQDETVHEDCRLYGFTGPLNVAMYTAICINSGFGLYVAGTDYSLVRGMVDDFMDGIQPSAPYRWRRVWE